MKNFSNLKQKCNYNLNFRKLNLNVKNEFLKKKTMIPELLNKPIRTEDLSKTDINFLEVETDYKGEEGLFKCCKKLLMSCRKKKNSKGLLEAN